MPDFPSPESVAQRQLDAYNAHDVDALLATYTEDVQQFEFPVTLLCSGAAALRERMTARLSDPLLHARLINRIVMGNTVIDHEEVTRTFPEGSGKIELVAIYEVRDGKIAAARFISGKVTLESTTHGP
ncbi:MAG: nuclear transport factor 2 family protein [Verrucomicrobiaceae bacterium]|nr:nuclear transport factor 2 family protein [Verrucomicrobiaceae bacterium]